MKRLIDAEERRLDWALGEVAGGQTPPDLTDRILERMREDAAPAEPGAALSTTHRGAVPIVIAAAAMIVVGIIAWLRYGDTEPSSQSDESMQAPIRVSSPDDLLDVPEDTKSIRAIGFAGADLESLQRVRSIEHLEIEAEQGAAPPESSADDGLKHLAVLTKLRELSLTWQRKLTDEGFRHLGKLPVLESLTLTGTSVNRDGVEAIADKLSGLRNLELRIQPQFGDDSLQILASMSWLRKLALVDCVGMTSPGLQRLGGLGQLTHLQLSNLQIAGGDRSAVDDAVLRSLRGLSQLRVLAIRGADVTRDGVHALAGCKRVTDLDLTGCAGVDDAGIRAVLGALSLRSLRLTGTRVTPAILDAILAEKSLEELHLRCAWVTPELRRKLSQLPRMRRLETVPE